MKANQVPLWRQIKDAQNEYHASPLLQKQFMPSEEEFPGFPESQRRWNGMKRYLKSKGLPND